MTSPGKRVKQAEELLECLKKMSVDSLLLFIDLMRKEGHVTIADMLGKGKVTVLPANHAT